MGGESGPRHGLGPETPWIQGKELQAGALCLGGTPVGLSEGAGGAFGETRPTCETLHLGQEPGMPAVTLLSRGVCRAVAP